MDFLEVLQCYGINGALKIRDTFHSFFLSFFSVRFFFLSLSFSEQHLKDKFNGFSEDIFLL